MGLSIKSDERLLDIVESLTTEGDAGVSELAARLDMAKSTVHSHLATLHDRGYVVKDDDAHYRVSLQFLDVGTVAQRARPVYEATVPKLEALADNTDEKVWCVVEEHGRAVFLASHAGDRAIQTDARVGHHVELYRLAAGKAILANLPENRRAEILAGYEFPIDGQVDRDAFEDELATIRDQGYARSDEFFVQSVSGLGAPIVDNDGVVHGAISFSCPTSRLDAPGVESELVDLLRGTVEEIGVNITYR